MAEAFEIRSLQPAELADYKRLRDTMLAAFPDAFSSDADEERDRSADSYVPRLADARPEGGHFTLGAWRGTRLIGALSCDRERRVKARHVGHLTAMMVASDVHGRGIGRALLAASIAEARRADGLELLTLSVTAHNLAAVRLYERSGFVRYARLPHALKLGERYVTKDLMVLTLSPAAASSA